MAQAEIGLIGLGVMGANLALNIAEKGFPIAVYNRTTETTHRFHAEAGPLKDRIIACDSLADLAAAIAPPRPVIIMVKAGDAVDQQIAELHKLLQSGDIIIDAGNADFHDTVRRNRDVEAAGLAFIGMGVSGGEEGARHGPSIMAGGREQAYARVEKVLTTIAARYQDEACCAWLGLDGAGHFVKMIHNGIEYADMQMIAEIYGLMRDGLAMPAAEIGAVFAAWNSGPLNSYLIEITAKVLATVDRQTGKPLVDVIVDSAGQKGTGKWSVIEAQTLSVPATAIESAVAARILSSLRSERAAAASAYALSLEAIKPAARPAFLRQLELALLAGKVAAYAQGFAVMARASQEHGWNLPLAVIARIWRAGCIIRSPFLDQIAQAYASAATGGNLMMVPAFRAIMMDSHGPLRRTVADGALAGLPLPALAAALSYFDSYRQARGTANLIQGQRDFFGAHSFERLDQPGIHHGPW